jgi:hypothetical protein
MEPTDIVQDADFEAAARRGAQRLKKGPVAVSARYDPLSGRVVVELNSGLEIGFRPQQTQGLEIATPADLGEIEISPSGQGLYFPAIDADLYLPALLDGCLGSKTWMAARMGQVGGSATTQAKQAAARANGRLGGRPRKKVVA